MEDFVIGAFLGVGLFGLIGSVAIGEDSCDNHRYEHIVKIFFVSMYVMAFLIALSFISNYVRG